MRQSTTGAPNTAVTELMDISRGAKAVRAMRSQNRQKAAPPRKQPGMTIRGLAVRNRLFTRWGTAMPTKEMGPAKAVTQADSRLDSKISSTRNRLMFTPMFWAYTSPSW